MAVVPLWQSVARDQLPHTAFYVPFQHFPLPQSKFCITDRELAGEGSIPIPSSSRRSNLAFLRVGSAACGNSELKVRHKYGAKRVFKLMIRADFSVVLSFFPGVGVEVTREDPPVHLCRAVRTYTG